MADSQENPLLGKIAVYTEILNADPRSTIFVSLSESYRKMGMLDEAHAVAVKGLAQLPDYAPGYVVLARIKCQQGEMDASKAAFSRALELDSDSLAALVGFSRLYLLLDNKSAARKLLLTARELSPADSVINKLLLSLPEVDPEPEVAEETSTQHQPEPEDSAPLPIEPLETGTLAELYLKQGMVDQALNIYRKLLSRYPDNLVFRRRIRDIELSATETTESSPDVVHQPATELVVETESEEAEIFSTLSGDEEENLKTLPPINEMSVLDHLNGLLISIQKRRGDV